MSNTITVIKNKISKEFTSNSQGYNDAEHTLAVKQHQDRKHQLCFQKPPPGEIKAHPTSFSMPLHCHYATVRPFAVPATPIT